MTSAPDFSNGMDISLTLNYMDASLRPPFSGLRGSYRQASKRHIPLEVQREPRNNGESARYSSGFGSPPTSITQADVDKCLEQITSREALQYDLRQKNFTVSEARDMHLPLHVKT